jgi:hypothetical protein
MCCSCQLLGIQISDSAELFITLHECLPHLFLLPRIRHVALDEFSSSASAYVVSKHRGQSRRSGDFHQQAHENVQLAALVSDQRQLKNLPLPVHTHYAEDGETGRPGQQLQDQASSIWESDCDPSPKPFMKDDACNSCPG